MILRKTGSRCCGLGYAIAVHSESEVATGMLPHSGFGMSDIGYSDDIRFVRAGLPCHHLVFRSCARSLHEPCSRTRLKDLKENNPDTSSWGHCSYCCACKVLLLTQLARIDRQAIGLSVSQSPIIAHAHPVPSPPGRLTP